MCTFNQKGHLFDQNWHLQENKSNKEQNSFEMFLEHQISISESFLKDMRHWSLQ